MKLSLNEIVEDYKDDMDAFKHDYAQFKVGDEVMWERENGSKWGGTVTAVEFNNYKGGYFLYNALFEEYHEHPISGFVDGELEAV